MDQLTRLLLDAQRGDQASLERFVAATRDDVLAMCRYLGDRDTADDLAQEAYERAFASLHRFRATGPAKHWLLTITRRTCADETRRRSRRRRTERRVLDEPGNTSAVSSSESPPPELGELLHQLDDDRRAAFVLTQLNGLRYEEAAELLGVPIGTIRSRVARAREQLMGAITAAEHAVHDDGGFGGADGEPGGRLRRPG